MDRKPTQLVRNRPAETGSLAAALAVLICYLLGVDDPGVLAALVVVVGALPSVITWIVELVKK
jgi:energy-converting hydrogenase Eha subunit B